MRTTTTPEQTHFDIKQRVRFTPEARKLGIGDDVTHTISRIESTTEYLERTGDSPTYNDRRHPQMLTLHGGGLYNGCWFKLVTE